MAIIPSTVTKVTTRQTTTSNVYTDIPGATIDASTLVAGQRYLLVMSSIIDGNTNTTNISIRTVHGTTAFDDSEYSFEPLGATHHQPYLWFSVWTAVGGEGLKLQFKTDDATNTIVGAADQIVLNAWQIDALQENVDWAYAEQNGNTTLTASYQTGASLSVTPTVAGEDWVVMALARVSNPSPTQAILTHLNVTGGATTSDPECQLEGEDATNDRQVNVVVKSLTLGATSYTFAEQTKNTGGGGPRTNSKILALRLPAFAAYAVAYDASQLDYTGGTSYGDNLQTATINLPMVLDVWCMGSLLYVPNSLGVSCLARIRVDGADDPATQTGDGYALCTSNDVADISPIHLQTVATSQAAGSHTLTLNGSASAATGKGAKSRFGLMIALATPSPSGGSGGAYYFRRSRG